LPSDLPPDDTRAELAIPMKFGDEVLGVLDLQNDQVEAFSHDDVSLLEALSASIAIAYHNASLYRSEQWRRQVGDSFRDVASLLSTNVALEQLLETILTELERSLPCDAAAVWLVEDPSEAQGDHGRALRLAAVHGISQDVINRAKDESDSMNNWLNELMNKEGPSTRKTEDPSGPLGAVLGFPDDYSSIAAALRTGDELLGIVLLAHHTANRYGTEARSILSTFASYAAVAIQNARLYSEAQTQAWLSTILLQVAEASQSVNSVDELLSSMVRLTRLLVGLKKCAVFLWDELQEAFILKDWYGLDQPHRTIFDPSEVPAITQMRRTRSMVYIQDPASELNLPAAALPPGSGSLILMPLLTRDSLQGAFLVAHQSSGPFGPQSALDQQTYSILQGIAHQTSVALENLHLLEARQEEAYVTAVLLQVAQAVVSQNELQDILDTIVHLMPILVGIDASIVCLWDPIQKTFHTAQVYAGSRELENSLSMCSYHPGQFNLLEQVRAEDAAFYCKVPKETLAPTGWFELEPMPIEFMKTDLLVSGEDWLLGFPLSVKGEMLGVLLAKETAASTIFHERRLEIITGIAQQVALAIQNERLTQEMVVRDRLEREVQLARQIQQTFLPNRLPRWEGWEIASRWEPAREVGGDFYDIFGLSRGRLGMAIADVSDKGLAAALYMTVARTLIRAYAQSARTASAVLQRANHPLVADTPHSMYVTAVFSILDPESGNLEYANAGHNRPLLLRIKDRTLEELPKGGMAMGVLARHQLTDHHLTLDPGDCLLFYTDGVTETFSAGGEAYGEERLRNILRGCFGLNAEEVLKKIEADLTEFRDSAPASDDVTLLAIRRLEWHV
jgi:sigma-B regulation protein RsbU (phosphoserine phosphatase)